jgi:hypothetical protein
MDILLSPGILKARLTTDTHCQAAISSPRHISHTLIQTCSRAFLDAELENTKCSVVRDGEIKPDLLSGVKQCEHNLASRKLHSVLSPASKSIGCHY